MSCDAPFAVSARPAASRPGVPRIRATRAMLIRATRGAQDTGGRTVRR